ncbi:uncharacterized protein LOC135696077 [Rhopilema esculentum]|uniref:uncharacterized protein LOC135696077 n=1 Tax=Rhopilema esculentum TaxID=499914 RepID=UPI0031D80CD0
MLVTVQNSSLLLHNETQLFFIPSIAESTSPESIVQVFKKDELSSLQISKILSISSSHRCNENIHVSWFDVLTLVQLSNKSIRVLIGSSWNQHQNWKAYSLPDWLSQVTYIETQIDFDRHSFILAANIGMPKRTIILVYDLADSERKELKLTSTPFFLDHALEKPKLKLLAKVPATLLYDQFEIWLSRDAGHNFRQIFGVQRDEKILQVETATESQKELVIITTSNVFRYSSFGLRRQLINSDLHCLATSQSVFISNGSEKYTFFCSDSVFGPPDIPKIVRFDTDKSLISSMSSSIVSDFEMKVSLPDVYNNVHDIILNMNIFCEISKFPNIHLCNAKGEQPQSHTLKLHPEMQYYPNCTYKLKNYNNSMYIMTAAPNQEGQLCKLWTASMIGRSVILLKAQASCWVKWLLNDTIAIVNCSAYNLKEEEEFFSSSDIAIVDSSGSERCQKSSSQVYMADSPGLFEINSTLFSFYDQVIEIGAIYVRLDNAVGKLSFHENRTFFALLGNVTFEKSAFTYVCFITDHDSDDKSKSLFKNSLKPCHFDVAYQGLQSADVFLDANDETEFNLTLSKILNEHPYLDQIPPFAIQPIEPTHVKVQIKSRMKLTPMTVEVLIKQKPYSNGTSLLSIYATTQPAHCKGSHKLITIHGTCPPGKHLTFEYPLVYDRDTWLYGNPNDHEGFTRLATIPFNYQPPSILGKAIPLTPNIYNADPSKPMHRSSYKISRDIAKYKQCHGKQSRASCGCTLNATISSRPDETDCIQRVFKVYFMEEFTPKLFVVDRDGTRTDLKFPYCITELNERKDYSIENKVRPGCMSAAKKSALKFDGSGLFHFRVNVIKSGYTFCDLQTYFIIFVADAPMPYPAQELVRAMTSFCFGSIILFVFLINFHLK